MTGWKWAVLVVAVGLIVWLISPPAPDEAVVTGFQVAPGMGDRPECPETTVTLAISGPITNIPEFHDCQRFILTRRGWFGRVLRKSWLTAPRYYGVYYAIWIRYNLDSVIIPPGLTATGAPVVPPQGSGYPSVADSVNRTVGTGSTIRPEGVGAGNAVPVAIIYSYGAYYRPLGINPGFNCLYLYHRGADTTQWNAVVVPVQDQGECLGSINPIGAPGQDLQVIATSPAVFQQGSDYPGVGRWDTDPTSGRLYAALRCGNAKAWCEVGPMGFHQSESYSATKEEQRVWGVKGWYDEQYLAEKSGSALVPGTIKGTVFPDYALDHLTRADFTKHWLTAYHVVLSASSSSYKTKLNLEAGSMTGQSNDISLCYGTKSDCIPPDRQSEVSCPDEGKPAYWADILAAESRKDVYKCITYRDHGAPMRGTVRWRFLYDDETNWARCPDGCCQVRQ